MSIPSLEAFRLAVYEQRGERLTMAQAAGILAKLICDELRRMAALAPTNR